jgi:hypothetical protein
VVIERIKWAVIVVLFLVDVVVFYVGYRVGEKHAEHALADRDQAILECTEDLRGKCGNLYEYAVSLEDENARLNVIRVECNNER